MIEEPRARSLWFIAAGLTETVLIWDDVRSWRLNNIGNTSRVVHARVTWKGIEIRLAVRACDFGCHVDLRLH
jgi:hypothetical protein